MFGEYLEYLTALPRHSRVRRVSRVSHSLTQALSCSESIQSISQPYPRTILFREYPEYLTALPTHYPVQRVSRVSHSLTHALSCSESVKSISQPSSHHHVLRVSRVDLPAIIVAICRCMSLYVVLQLIFSKKGKFLCSVVSGSLLRTVQSALHFTSLADLFHQTPSQFLWEASSHIL